MKLNRFLLFSLVFFVLTVFAQETPSQDTAETELDLKALLAAMKHHDRLLKSGEGEVVYTLGVPPFVDPDTEIITGTIAFNKKKTRFHTEKRPFPFARKNDAPYTNRNVGDHSQQEGGISLPL